MKIRRNKTNLILNEGPLDEAYGETKYEANVFSGIINVTVTLDPSRFQGVSQEYIAATIIHEGFHSIVKVLTDNNLSADDEHIALFTTYIDLLANGLQAAYPNMTPGDAKGLILRGILALEQKGEWPSSYVDKVLQKVGYSRAQIQAIRERYRTNASGSPCN